MNATMVYHGTERDVYTLHEAVEFARELISDGTADSVSELITELMVFDSMQGELPASADVTYQIVRSILDAKLE